MRHRRLASLVAAVIGAACGTAPAFNAGTHETTGTATRSEDSPLKLALGSGVAWTRGGGADAMRGIGKAGLMFDATLLTTLGESSSWLIGGTVGTTFWDFIDPRGVGAQTMGLSILPTAVYLVPTPREATFRPFIALSVGPQIAFVRLRPRIDQDPDVYLTALARPGVAMNLSREVTLQLESKVGLMASSFTIAPQLSIAFPLHPRGHKSR